MQMKFIFTKKNTKEGQEMGKTLTDKELENLIEESGVIDTEPLYVMAYHSFLRSQEFDIYEKVVFLNLKSYAGKNVSCFPGQKGIAQDLKISRKKVSETIQSLEKKGALIIVNQRKESNRKTSNQYILATFDGNEGKFNEASLARFESLRGATVKVKGK